MAKAKRGFAAMTAEKQRGIASKGGRAAHEAGTAHEWTAKEASDAGKKGGRAGGGHRKKKNGEPAPPTTPKSEK